MLSVKEKRHASLCATQLKRKTQICKTFEVKIKSRFLTKTQKNFLQLFEATTKRCHICDTVIEGGLELEQREFMCPHCGLKMNRDEQAARMILKLGLMKSSSTTVGVGNTKRVKKVKISSQKSVENVVRIFDEAEIMHEIA